MNQLKGEINRLKNVIDHPGGGGSFPGAFAKPENQGGGGGGFPGGFNNDPVAEIKRQKVSPFLQSAYFACTSELLQGQGGEGEGGRGGKSSHQHGQCWLLEAGNCWKLATAPCSPSKDTCTSHQHTIAQGCLGERPLSDNAFARLL